MRNHIILGTTRHLQNLYAQRDKIVRYLPNEISVIWVETAWQNIHGFRTGRSKKDSY
jgi:hypothetical protein